ncbi:lipoate--protein ligase family protein [Bacillus sp. Marseille-P3661]|uniref:lipoate--protein ligase family protein n=1 Tax=Bacillus sp. Marseille-P3661 TaxID=1936234 RepID=UPI000C830DF8|nr:biotin/lipoate A/B protein ligase family protein [Bacillus sp. Marseille-P3661]
MSKINTLLTQKEWRFIDHSSLGLHFDPLQSFAYDDTFCSAVGSGQSPAVIRAWVHRPTIVLGIQDARLPYIDQGISFLKQSGYEVIVRNSGGLAVVLDEGILNLSLILPENQGSIEINRGYEAMWQLTQLMLAQYPVHIEAKEIVGSYCPGSYDLSIHNQKFAGISQRRLRNGVAVQIYLCVNGSGANRAELIREFYEHSIKNEPTKFIYPAIIPSTMASLSELLNEDLTIEKLMVHLLNTLKNLGSAITPSSLTHDELQIFEQYYDRIIKRNEKAW